MGDKSFEMHENQPKAHQKSTKGGQQSIRMRSGVDFGGSWGARWAPGRLHPKAARSKVDICAEMVARFGGAFWGWVRIGSKFDAKIDAEKSSKHDAKINQQLCKNELKINAKS